jgi:putative ABC transport system permease protein
MAGRAFTNADGPDAPAVVIINETFARRFWPDDDPLGKRWKFGGPNSQAPWTTIVGIVADSRRTGFDAQPRCEAFFPNAQNPSGALTVVVRTANDPLQLAGTLRANVHSIDPDLPVHNIKTMDELLGSMMSQRRLNMLLFGILAGVALVLAAVGIYGVIAYSVTERTHEIGIRIALGAPSTEILKLVMGQAMLLAAGGVVLGLLAAFALTRVMSSLLYGVSATDATTFVVIAVLLPSVGLLASYIPARRAMKVDPMVALRHE